MPGASTWAPLPREQVVAAVERRGPSRIPMIMAKWWGEGFVERHGRALARFDRFPNDAALLLVEPVVPERMGLSWEIEARGAHDARCALPRWSQLEEFVRKLPDPCADPGLDALAERAAHIRDEGRYLLFGWWRLFFERPWGIRGMERLLMDYYLEPEMVHRLHGALCELYVGYLRRAAEVIVPDGFWTSDDLGHQQQLFMSPEIFRALIKPYYATVGETLRELGLHWWLHSCGNNSEILGDLIETGVDVFHPVQKGTMDEARTAREYGERLTFLVGFDVQHTLVEGDVQQVRREVRDLIDTFDRPDGGMCLAAGNGILPGTPLENVEAYLEEALRYGTAHRRRHGWHGA